MSPQATIPEDSSAEQHAKSLRSRKIYIQLRIPRVKAEIAAVATQKKSLSRSGGEPSKEIIEELIYSNQHMLALRNELESLEQEHTSVLKDLKEIKLKETGKPNLALVER